MEENDYIIDSFDGVNKSIDVDSMNEEELRVAYKNLKMDYMGLLQIFNNMIIKLRLEGLLDKFKTW